MLPRLTAPLLVAAVLVPAACGPSDAAGGADAADSTPVAQTGDHTFTVAEAVDLLEGHDDLPNEREVVRAVADLWLDHVLLARAARSDTAFASVDLSRIVQDRIDEEMVLALRDSVIRVDTTFTDDELRSLFEQQAPGTRIRARHILLDFPDEAGQAQRDSVRERARELRRRALEGEDFAELARRYSQDQASAERGGDLGTFGRGEMVPSFEEAAFGLEPGTVSEPVESPYGLHLIRVEEREAPSFEDRREQFVQRLRNRRVAEAESAYVSQLEDSVELRIAPDAHRVVRGLAGRPDARLTPRASDRALVEYRGGALTAAEYLEFVQGRPLAQRRQLAAAGDEQVDGLLRSLARRELLVARAREAGLEPPEDRRDSLRTQIAGQLDRVVEQMGLREVSPREGESPEEAVDRRVRQLLEEILNGERQVTPLGSLAFTLRRDHDARLFEPALDRVVDRLEPEEDERAEESTGSGVEADTAPPRGTDPGR